MIKQLDQDLVYKVTQSLKGAKLAKFMNSVQIINDSLAQQGWVLRGSVKANSGFYQGITRTGYEKPRWDGRSDLASEEQDQAENAAWELEHCFNFGGRFRNRNFELALKTLKEGKTREGNPVKLKLTDEQARAWVALCDEKHQAVEFLNALRPLPVVTKIGLSPKVTATLTEMNLDIEISSIRHATIDYREVPLRDKKGCLVKDEDGKQVMTWEPYIKWTPGIVHDTSRFATGYNCHACNKFIPSGRFVPIEAQDKKNNRLISMWIGEDCARNIFGIKAKGLNKSK